MSGMTGSSNHLIGMNTQ